MCILQRDFSDGVVILVVCILFFLFERRCLRFCVCNFLDFAMLVIKDAAVHLVRNSIIFIIFC